ncbi:hypothetical protein GGX14DRAFT_677884 [Mycena pura]|uniref:Uncharacterized protein n=1 Tax=Mycena pura TaxID=153505 RepID=A0AAD6UVW9_9AGAR|nr:hypothetical protein GGX14DRAFT_677884 [Mycena pura]
MLDHYYTPRDLPSQQMIPNACPMDLLTEFDTPVGSATGKPLPPRAAVVDLSALDLDQLAFDCDSGSESGSDDGYVSTLLRIQRSVSLVPTPRKIAGARRVARAVSSPRPVRAGMVVDVEVQVQSQARTSGRSTPEGELFQSITAIPGLESTSFEVCVSLLSTIGHCLLSAILPAKEWRLIGDMIVTVLHIAPYPRILAPTTPCLPALELRLETYLQSLIATGTARPQPAFAPALVIPPTFSTPFCDCDKDAAKRDVEMEDVAPDAPSAHPPFVFPAASFPPALTEATWS